MKKSKWIVYGMSASLVLSIASLSFSLAWYASSSTLRIDTLEINVRGDYRLFISDEGPEKYTDSDGNYDQISYLRSFERHDYLDDDARPLIGRSSVDTKVIEPVTTMNTFKTSWHEEASWLKEKKNVPTFLGSYQDVGARTPRVPQPSQYGYYSQTLYLFSEDNVYVTLDPYGCIFNGVPVDVQQVDQTTSDADKIRIDAYNLKVREAQEREQTRLHLLNKESCLQNRYGKDPSIDDATLEQWASKMDNLYKALRVSLLVPDDEFDHTQENYSYAVFDPFKEEETLFAGRLNTGVDSFFDTYVEDDHYKEIIYGDLDETTRENAIYSSITNEITPTNGTISEYELSCFNSYTKANCESFDLEASLTSSTPLKVASENAINLKELQGRNPIYTIPVYRNKPRKVVLSVYLEGWDLDCISSTMGAYFTSVISFKIAREM